MVELNSEGRYTDLPHTLFPQASDDEAGHPLMSNISGSLFEAAKDYSNKIAQGNAFGAQTVLQNNPGLVDTMFTAEKYNWMRDAIIAMQKYYVSDVKEMIKQVADHTIGLDDDNTMESPGTNGYSIEKITSIVNGTKYYFNLAPSTWSTNTYTPQYELQIDGITQDDDIDIILNPQTATISQAKAWSKAMVLGALQTTNKITLKAYGKITPDVTIPIIAIVHK